MPDFSGMVLLCPKCGYEVRGEGVEVVDNGVEKVVCVECMRKYW